MTANLPEKQPTAAGARHAIVGVVFGAALMCAFVFHLGQPGLWFFGDRLFQLAGAVAPTAMLLLGCAFVGLLFLPRAALCHLDAVEVGLFVCLAGVPMVSAACLILGAMGWMSPAVAWAGLVILAAVGGVRWWKARKWLAQATLLDVEANVSTEHVTRATRLGHRAVTALCVWAGLVILVSALAPPLVYDVTEYHLGAFRDYSVEGRWQLRPVPHNMYARFPFPVEAIYYFGIFLESETDFSPKLLNAAAVFGLVMLASRMLARWHVPLRWRRLACLAILAHPVLLEVSLDAYIDAPTALFVLASLYVLERAFGGFGPPVPRQVALRLLPLFGWLGGNALVTKYTVAQLYALAALVWGILVMVQGHRNGANLQKTESHAVAREGFWETSVRRWLVVSAGAFSLPLLLWLGKNAVFYGNPLEPFFVWLFHPTDTQAVLRERFYIESHYPQPLWSASYWRTLPTRLEAFQWFLLAPLVTLPWIRPRPAGARLLMVVALSYLAWNLIRYSQDRFLLASFVLVSVIVVDVMSRIPIRWLRWVGALGIAATSAANLLLHTVRVANGGEFAYLAHLSASPSAQAWEARGEFYRRNLGALGEIVARQAPPPFVATGVNSAGTHLLRPTDRVFLVYEARPYLFVCRTTYNTVFDDSVLLSFARGAKAPSEIDARLRSAGLTHVLVNREELRRFIHQYARPEQLEALGVTDVMGEFPKIHTPEDLYPPFYLAPNWKADRSVVLAWLAELRKRAVWVGGSPPIEIYLATIP